MKKKAFFLSILLGIASISWAISFRIMGGTSLDKKGLALGISLVAENKFLQIHYFSAKTNTVYDRGTSMQNSYTESDLIVAIFGGVKFGNVVAKKFEWSIPLGLLLGIGVEKRSDDYSSNNPFDTPHENYRVSESQFLWGLGSGFEVLYHLNARLAIVCEISVFWFPSGGEDVSHSIGPTTAWDSPGSKFNVPLRIGIQYKFGK